MREEGLEEWDADFLDQLIQVEEFALSASSATSKSNLNPLIDPCLFIQNPSLLPQAPPPPQPELLHGDRFSYSPPRQLAHRSAGFNDKIVLRTALCSIPQEIAKDLEINRLKRELEVVSKKLSKLEDECFELKTSSRFKRCKSCESPSRCINRNEADDPCLENTNMNTDVLNHPKGLDVDSKRMDHLDIHAFSASKSETIRADEAGELSMVELDDDPPSHIILSEKLRNIWGCPSNSKLGLGLMSTLFLTCSMDFHVLFGCMRTNLLSKKQIDCLASEEPSSASSHGLVPSLQNSEAVKISHLYYVLTKINNGIFPIEALFGPLLGLCEAENVAILGSSLKVLHAFLKHLFIMKREDGSSGIYSGSGTI